MEQLAAKEQPTNLSDAGDNPEGLSSVSATRPAINSVVPQACPSCGLAPAANSAATAATHYGTNSLSATQVDRAVPHACSSSGTYSSDCNAECYSDIHTRALGERPR